jgi:dTDP-4-dehydrorhamnose reductase
VYISTDYVFQGRPGEAPYATTDTPDPPNLYGLTKLEGEHAVLAAYGVTHKMSAARAGAVVLRVPLLYGHCEPEEKTKSAVHALLDVLDKAQTMGEGEPKVKVDNYSLRFPTCTEDVGRVIADTATLYLDAREPGAAEKRLPSVLHFSAVTKPFTKWDMVRIFAEDILGLSLKNLEPHNPTKDPGARDAVQRPYDTHLSPRILRELGVDVSCQDFVGWW